MIDRSPTHVLPFPAATPTADREDDLVPRWCVRRFPAVGADALTLIGFNGEGYPRYRVDMPVTANLELWQRVIQRELDMERAGQSLRPSVLPSRLNLLP